MQEHFICWFYPLIRIFKTSAKKMPSPYANHAHVNSKELSEQSTQGGHDAITGFFALLRMTHSFVSRL